MRILLVGENHRAEIRGRTIAIHGLARALRDRGHEVTLAQAALPEHRVTIEGVRMLYVSTTRKSLYPLALGALSLRGHDIVHTNDEAGAWLALRSRFRRGTLVAHFHAPRMRFEPLWRANWRWRYIEMAARLASTWVTPSRWLARELASRFALPEGRVHDIPCGLKPIWFDARRPPDSRATGKLRVALVNMKGVDVALRAFARAGVAGAAHLELYGVDKSQSEHEALARALGIERHVAFRGFIDHDELPAQLAGADVLLHPSRAESFGQVLAEAAALGIPALSSRTTAIPEIVEEGRTGLLCPSDDVEAFASALAELCSSVEFRGRLGDAARQRAERLWRWDHVAARFESELYAPLLARLRSSGSRSAA